MSCKIYNIYFETRKSFSGIVISQFFSSPEIGEKSKNANSVRLVS